MLCSSNNPIFVKSRKQSKLYTLIAKPIKALSHAYGFRGHKKPVEIATYISKCAKQSSFTSTLEPIVVLVQHLLNGDKWFVFIHSKSYKNQCIHIHICAYFNKTTNPNPKTLH